MKPAGAVGLKFKYREIAPEDVPALFDVRVVTHENRLTREELHAMGITIESVRERLGGSYRGWLCEADGRTVGFAIGDQATGELWVIAVLPEYIGMGIGSNLLRRVETWLVESGCTHLWLTTDVDPTLKAYTFYRQHGWQDDRVEEGMRYMVKDYQAPS